jgi:hypothetical protein
VHLFSFEQFGSSLLERRPAGEYGIDQKPKEICVGVLVMRFRHLESIIVMVTITGLVLAALVVIYHTSRPRPISFSVIAEGYSLIIPAGFPRSEPEPSLMIIAGSEDVKQSSMFVFPEPLEEKIAHTDFKTSFLLLVRRGHPDRGLVKMITKQQARVVITAYDLVPRPGNYVVEGWTQPYQVIRVDKNGGWGKPIRFVLQRETQGTSDECVHFVP